MAGSFGKSLKRAFTWHWNLLGLGAGVAFGILSGKPDVVLPIVVAAEMAFIGFIGIHPRFQKVLIGKEMMEATPPELPFEAKLDRVLSQLADEDIRRFQQLRSRIRKLILLRRRVQEADPEFKSDASFRIESLDKLLWLFLKLQHQRNALAQFTESTDRDALVANADATRVEIDEVTRTTKSPRLLRSLEEKLETIEQRLANYDESEANLRIVNIELDKTEQKINHICELGMTNADGIDLSSKIEALASSLESNERAMNEMSVSSPFERDIGPRPVLLDLDEIESAERMSYE